MGRFHVDRIGRFVHFVVLCIAIIFTVASFLNALGKLMHPQYVTNVKILNEGPYSFPTVHMCMLPWFKEEEAKKWNIPKIYPARIKEIKTSTYKFFYSVPILPHGTVYVSR